jgi:CheY-like chemotaxis protein
VEGQVLGRRGSRAREGVIERRRQRGRAALLVLLAWWCLASAPALELLLVVEDDDDVRAYTVEMLRQLSYAVIEAADGRAALRLLDAEPDIRLLFTDVGLPGGFNGRQLAHEARRRRPDLKVLYAAGYARNAIIHHGRVDPGVELLAKPFTQAALATKIRQVLQG